MDETQSVRGVDATLCDCRRVSIGIELTPERFTVESRCAHGPRSAAETNDFPANGLVYFAPFGDSQVVYEISFNRHVIDLDFNDFGLKAYGAAQPDEDPSEESPRRGGLERIGGGERSE